MTVILALARSPAFGAATAVRDGSLRWATALVGAATAVSLAHAVRYASLVSVEDVVFGPERSPLVTMLLATVGRDLTAVVVYVVERAWVALLVVTAISPVLIWILGATAIHAAARLGGSRERFGPILVLVGLATGLTRPVADLAGLLFGPRGTGGALAQIAGAGALVWLAVLLWHGVRAHYGVDGGRGLAILAVALVLFYLAPLALAVLALVAVLIAAVVLEYFPAR